MCSCQLALFGQARLGDDGIYDPANPGDPQVPVLKHQLRVEASPQQGGSFNVVSEKVSEGGSISLYAYPDAGFVFKGWMQGDSLLSETSPYTYTMGSKDAVVKGLFEYNPENPSNPGANSWDASTGEVVVDDFEPGRLSSAVSTVIGGSTNQSAVTMVVVSGEMSSYDFGFTNYYDNCTLLDLSRSYGYTEIPSYGFDGSGLTTVILPSCVERIGNYAFYGCGNLADLTCYSVVPPTVEAYAFDGLAEGAVLHVLSSSISLYAEAEGWKDFTILPLSENVQALEVTLPADGTDGRYKNMTLELVNTKSGQRQKFLISDRLVYTFNGLLKDTEFNLYVRNDKGAVLGQIDGIVIADEDIRVAFESLLQPQDVALKVTLPDGTDVTSQVQATWLDANGQYLQQGSRVSGLLAGTSLSCKVSLPKELGMSYLLPQDTVYTVQEGANELALALQPLAEVTVSGRVTDASTGMPLSGAAVSVSQRLNGLYSKAFITNTDSKGGFSLKVYNSPSTIVVSASDYLNATLERADFNASADLGDVALKTISGATITTNYTYTSSVAEGETADVENWYSDYANVSYTIYNETAGREITQFSVQYPTIVLLEEVAEGDRLRLTASSRTGAFRPVEAEAVIGADNRAEVTLPIVELGGIRAGFSTTDNASVVGILYDGNGQLVKKYNYTNAALSITGLSDGVYTLVTMSNSSLFNSILNLSQFAASGLTEGTDYVQNTVEVESGTVAVIANDLVPVLDESKLYYTGDNTMFSVNKTSIVAGNYLTLKGKIDFRDNYASQVSDVSLVVDLPASCSFVENSVMVGSKISSYMIDGNRLTVPLSRYSDEVKFCVIPTDGGDYAPNAFASFTMAGEEILQPIGSANYTVKDLSITVPSTVAKTTIPVNGTALGNSTVQIYDNGVLIGETTSLANGVWSTTCELNEPYNLSTHEIYAKVVTPQGMELQSETMECLYNSGAVEAKTVTMTFYNGWLNDNVSVVFDFQTGKTSESSYMFYTTTDVTFIADLTNNDTTVVSGVNIYVYTDHDEIRKLPCRYDANTDKWVAVSQFSSFNLPINVSVDFLANDEVLVDREEFDLYANKIEQKEEDMEQTLDSINALEQERSELDALIAKNEADYSNWLQQIEQSDGSSDVDSLLIEYLNRDGGTFDKSDFEISVPETIDESYIDRLVFVSDSLLAAPLDRADTIELDGYNSRLEALLAEPDENFDVESFLAQAEEDTISVETEDGLVNIWRVPLSSLDASFISEKDTVLMEMTEGEDILIYISDDQNLVIVDSVRQEALCVQSVQVVNEVKALFAPSAVGRSVDFVAAINSAKQKVGQLIENFTKWFGPIVDKMNDEVTRLNKELDAALQQRAVLVGQSAGKHIRINELDKQIKLLAHNDVAAADFGTTDRIELRNRLMAERNGLLREIKACDRGINRLEKTTKGLQAKVIGKLALLGTLKDSYDVVMGLKNMFVYADQAIKDRNRWRSFIDGIEPCEGAPEEAAFLKMEAEDDWTDIAWKQGYYPAFGVTTLTTAINGYMVVNKGVGLVLKYVVGVVTDFMKNTATSMFRRAKLTSDRWYAECKMEYAALDCKEDDEEDEEDDDTPEPPFDPVSPIHDPSGYVYEGVSSNRVEGVTATCYYKETVEDMYGDKHENVVLWNAAEYAQENPLFTDENGMYRWDVPQGLWQVKFEKEGYETTYSEWLPVPPPQLEVNIGLTQNRQPEVAAAHAYEDGVEVEFDKYMMTDKLTTENIFVTKNGEDVAGTVTLLDEEQAYGGNPVAYASKVRFVPEVSFLATDEVVLTVSRKVQSYAGVPMEADYTQAFDIEREVKQLVADSLVKVAYTGSKTLTVSALPYDAGIGKKLVVKSSSEMIASVSADTLQLNENGQATFTVGGELPGTSVISFALTDAAVKGSSIIQVTTETLAQTAAPVASRASGTAVYRGSTVELSSETENATIYYTTDGTCPCDENGTRQVYTGPIAITEDMTLKAQAVSGELEDSEVAEFSYTVKTAATGLTLHSGWNWISHGLEAAVPATELQENAERIVGQETELVKDPAFGLTGNLDELDPQEAYKVQVSEDTQHTLGGYAFNPATPFSLKTGWNWLGYPMGQTMTLAEAFADAEPEEEDYIVGQDGFAQFAEGVWTGTLNTLVPGKGYLYHSQGDKQFTYNADLVSKAQALYASGLPNAAPWAVDKYQYPDIMCLVADLYDGGLKVAADEYAVGAFCGTECRGIGRYVDGKLMMNIYGEAGETITFKAMEEASEQLYGIRETAVFEETLLGSLNRPYTLNLGDTETGISAVESGWKVWMDVASDKLYVSHDGGTVDKVSLTDVYGSMVLVQRDVQDGAGIDVSHLADGVYIVTAQVGSEVHYKKIVKAGR